jgi:hypothetical protein
MEGKITSFDMLKALLAKAFWVESRLEHASQWSGYMQVQESQAKDVLFQISNESEYHKARLKEINNKIKDFEVHETLNDLHLGEPEFNFERKLDPEIFQKIMETERFALEIYTKIYEATDPDLIKNVWMEENPGEFFSTFSWLIEQEKEHIRLLEPFSFGHIERIA